MPLQVFSYCSNTRTISFTQNTERAANSSDSWFNHDTLPLYLKGGQDGTVVEGTKT